jgi:hypothetical protein
MRQPHSTHPREAGPEPRRRPLRDRQPFSSSSSLMCLSKAMCASTSSGAHWSIRGTGRCGSGPAAVVLEKQVLRHRGLLVSWAASVEALHLTSGADRRFSTSCASSERRAITRTPRRKGTGHRAVFRGTCVAPHLRRATGATWPRATRDSAAGAREPATRRNPRVRSYDQGRSDRGGADAPATGSAPRQAGRCPTGHEFADR